MDSDMLWFVQLIVAIVATLIVINVFLTSTAKEAKRLLFFLFWVLLSVAAWYAIWHWEAMHGAG